MPPCSHANQLCNTNVQEIEGTSSLKLKQSFACHIHKLQHYIEYICSQRADRGLRFKGLFTINLICYRLIDGTWHLAIRVCEKEVNGCVHTNDIDLIADSLPETQRETYLISESWQSRMCGRGRVYDLLSWLNGYWTAAFTVTPAHTTANKPQLIPLFIILYKMSETLMLS